MFCFVTDIQNGYYSLCLLSRTATGDLGALSHITVLAMQCFWRHLHVKEIFNYPRTLTHPSFLYSIWLAFGRNGCRSCEWQLT